MGMYEDYKTNEVLEATEGIDVERGSFKVTLLRSGGANKRYLKTMERKAKPLRRVIKAEKLESEVAQRLNVEGFAEAVVINWQTKIEDEWHRGIENPEGGELLPFTKENVLITLNNLPDLYEELQEISDKAHLFLESVKEADAKNL